MTGFCCLPGAFWFSTKLRAIQHDAARAWRAAGREPSDESTHCDAPYTDLLSTSRRKSNRMFPKAAIERAPSMKVSNGRHLHLTFCGLLFCVQSMSQFGIVLCVVMLSRSSDVNLRTTRIGAGGFELLEAPR